MIKRIIKVCIALASASAVVTVIGGAALVTGHDWTAARVNDVGDAFVRIEQAGFTGVPAARRAYAATALFGDARGANNIAVLDMHLALVAPHLPERQASAMQSRARKAWRDLRDDEAFPAAAYNLGIVNYGASSKSRFYRRGNTRLRAAVALGDPMAARAYALHLSTKRTHPDRQERQRLLKSLADGGDPIAATAYGDMVRGDGPGCTAETPYFLIGARAGVMLAQEHLSRRGGCSKTDDIDRRQWQRAAAAQGSPIAAYWLATAYLSGEMNENGSPNPKAAARWFEVAVDEGLRRTKQTSSPEPDGRNPDRIVVRSDGLRWRGAGVGRMSDVTSSKDAAFELAVLYMHGDGVKVDWDEAERLFAYAALGSHPIADVTVAQRLAERGDGERSATGRRRIGAASRDLLERRLHTAKTAHLDAKTVWDALPLDMRAGVEKGWFVPFTPYDLARYRADSDQSLDRSLIEAIGASGQGVLPPMGVALMAICDADEQLRERIDPALGVSLVFDCGGRIPVLPDSYEAVSVRLP